jgi:hypothetical protein
MGAGLSKDRLTSARDIDLGVGVAVDEFAADDVAAVELSKHVGGCQGLTWLGPIT